MTKLKVALSPFHNNPDGYADEVSGLVFKNKPNGEVVIYDISNETKLDGIRKAIRLNVLFLMEGELPQEIIPVVEPEPVKEVTVEIELPEAEVSEPQKEASKPKYSGKKK